MGALSWRKKISRSVSAPQLRVTGVTTTAREPRPKTKWWSKITFKQDPPTRPNGTIDHAGPRPHAVVDENGHPLSRASTLSSTDENYLSSQVNPFADPHNRSATHRQPAPRRTASATNVVGSSSTANGAPRLTEQQLNELAGVYAPPAPRPPRLTRGQWEDLEGSFAPRLPPAPPVMRKNGVVYE